MMVDCVREMTAKKSLRCGELGLFEHLLVLFIQGIKIQNNLT